MIYKFAIGLAIALLLTANRSSAGLADLSLLNNLYISFPTGIAGITLLLLRVGTGILSA